MPCSDKAAGSAALRLMGSYRRGDYQDPEIFMSGLRALFRAYPEAVVARVTNSVTGIQVTISYPPSMEEIKRACERAIRPIYEDVARREREVERAKLDSLPKPPEDTPERRKATIAAFRAQHPSAFDASPRNLTPAAAEAHLAAAEAQATAKPNTLSLSEAGLRTMGLTPKSDAVEPAVPTCPARRPRSPARGQGGPRRPRKLRA